MRQPLPSLLVIIAIGLYSCEKQNEIDDNNVPSYFMWTNQIDMETNGFSCESYKDDFFIAGRYILKVSSSDMEIDTLYKEIPFITGLSIVSDSVIFAVGLRGQVIKSIDNGVNWINISPNESIAYADCYFYDENNGIIIGGNSVVKKTQNSGETWEDISGISSPYLEEVIFTNPSTGFIGCGGQIENDMNTWYTGHIYKTYDKGTTWESKLSTNTIVSSLSFPSNNIGYAVTVTGDAYKSIDNGENWIRIINSDTISYGFNSVKFLNNSVGYISGTDWQHDACEQASLILKTINGGESWTIDYRACLLGDVINDIAFGSEKGIALTHRYIIPCELNND